MKYLLLIYGNHDTWHGFTPDTVAEIAQTHKEVQEELRASGELVDTHSLSIEDARVLRREDGEVLSTDGPFVEAKEILAGYYIVDVADADRAAAIAGRFVELDFAPVEVRRITIG